MNRLPTLFALVCAFGIFTSVHTQTSYNIYFGENHSHTWYSDGNKDQNKTTYTTPVARSITWAREHRSSFDFLGISDHNHNESLNMTLAYWRSGFREADSVNQDGNFVGFFGQEWGTLNEADPGHVLVYGTDKLFGWNPGLYDVFVAKGDYSGLFTAVKANNGYCHLAHPGSNDFDGIFTNAYNANWDSVIQGVAMKSGNAFSTNITETDPDAGDYTTQYHDLLRKGYHVAPIGNQDNHNTTFGKSNQQRTGLLAASLTKANVDNAFRNRRVYATEDHNLQVQFEVGTHRMGEIFSMSGSIPIRVKAIDAGESFSRIEIRYGVPGSGTAPTTLQYVTGRDSLVFTQSQSIGTTYYYYAYVAEADGHRAWTAPMWITITSGSNPGPFTHLSPSNGSTGQPVSGTLRWQTSSTATGYDVYLGTNNPPTSKVSSNQTDTFYNYSGLNNYTTYYWKIVARNATGLTDATGSPWNFTTIQLPPGSFNLLSPSNGAVDQSMSGTLTWQVSANANNYDVYLDQNNPPTTIVSTNQTNTFYNYSSLPEGVLIYWKIVAKNASFSTVATGAPWSFTTIILQPGSFTLISPANGATDQPINGTLTWNRSARALLYDIYLDNNNPPLIRVDSNLVDSVYTYQNFSGGSEYFWSVVAKNAYGNIVASNAPRAFTTLDVPIAPSNIASDSIMVKSISFSWIDNADNETGYRLYRALSLDGPYVQVGDDLPPNSKTYSDTGLQPGQQYFYRVVPFNDLGEGNYEESVFVVLSAVPGPPTITNVEHFSLRLYVDPNENASTVQYAIKVIQNTNEYFLQQDSSLGSVVKWQTYSDWGGANGIYVHGLQPCLEYSFLVKAKNADQIESYYGNTTSQLLPCDIVSRNVDEGWNLLSVPLRISDSRKDHLFPTSISEAFSYKGSYTPSESLKHGGGYWLKFRSSENVFAIGDFSWTDTVNVVAGWNIIGSIVETLNVANIITEPPDIIASDYFYFSGIYSRSYSINPMQGYWVKTNSAGKLILPHVTQKVQSQAKESDRFVSDMIDSFIFENPSGNKQTLFLVHSKSSEDINPLSELPPRPPLGGFDVRFSSQSDVRCIDMNSVEQRFPFTIQSGAFPVKMHWECNRSDLEYQFVDGHEVKTLDSQGEIYIYAPPNEFSIVVRNKKISETPNTFALYQNYPNPFNPSTTVSFDLPKKSFVRLVIYNILGVAVSTLVDEVKESGQYHIPWKPSCASGTFYYRIEIANVDNPKETHYSTKIMTLLK